MQYAKKKWGQNFLADTNLLKRIVRTVNPQPEDLILEIGPGEGALTERIIPMVKAMAAVEIDPFLINYLENQPQLKDLNIIHGDILLQKIDKMPVNNPVRIIGNIPYNITSSIIFWLIEQLDNWADAFIMMQKEVAERIMAKSQTREYNRLAVLSNWRLEIKKHFNVSNNCFFPKPKVISTVLSFKPKRN